MIYPRKLYAHLKKHLDTRQVTVITGMRRTGKTTLVKQLLEEVSSANRYYFDLERLDNREFFLEKNYDNIIKTLSRLGLDSKRKMFIALDEIQLVPEIVSVIKYLYDHYSIKFIVTGSSSYYLKHLFRESLAGRKKIFELYPLDFGEYLVFQGQKSKQLPFSALLFDAIEYERLKSDYESYIRYGGFPEVVLARKDDQKRDLLWDILSSYMSIDIKSVADLRDDRALLSLIRMLAVRVGTRLDYSKLSGLTGLSRPTVTNYVDLLEKTYLISRISVHTSSPDREIVKAQKVYFADTGVMNIVTEASSGTQFENTLHNQFARRGQLAYWARKSGQEIDFIFNETVAMEVKETPTQSDKKILDRLSSSIGIKKCYLIGRYRSPAFQNFIWGGSIQ